MWMHFYIENNVGVSIIDSILHCHTENTLKRGKIKIWLRFYIEDKVGVCIIDSILPFPFHLYVWDIKRYFCGTRLVL